MPKPRTPEFVARLTALWEAGETAVSVAAILAREFGEPVSMASVAGYAYRLHLSKRVVRESDARPDHVRVRVSVEERLGEAARALGVDRAITPAPTCMWIVRADFRVLLRAGNHDIYCGAKSRPGRSFCDAHCRVAYAPYSLPDHTF
jgi:hypothetical protein